MPPFVMQNQVSELLRASLVLSISVVICSIGSRVWGSCSGPRGAATATARSQARRLTLNFTKVKPSHNHHNNDFLYLVWLLSLWRAGLLVSQTVRLRQKKTAIHVGQKMENCGQMYVLSFEQSNPGWSPSYLIFVIFGTPP